MKKCFRKLLIFRRKKKHKSWGVSNIQLHFGIGISQRIEIDSFRSPKNRIMIFAYFTTLIAIKHEVFCCCTQAIKFNAHGIILKRQHFVWFLFPTIGWFDTLHPHHVISSLSLYSSNFQEWNGFIIQTKSWAKNEIKTSCNPSTIKRVRENAKKSSMFWADCWRNKIRGWIVKC